MSGSIDERDAAPNLTPILDMVFQLITFFMLMVNFKAASIDQSLKLPVIGSARPLDTKGQEELLVLNINTTGRLMVFGTVREPESYIAAQAEASLRAARHTRPELKPGDELPTMVVIRADRLTPFHLVNRIVKLCQDQGFRTFGLKTLREENKR